MTFLLGILVGCVVLALGQFPSQSISQIMAEAGSCGDCVFDATTNSLLLVASRANRQPGRLSRDIGNHAFLRKLDIREMMFKGSTLPTEIELLTNLVELAIVNCDVGGTLPALGKLTQLTSLMLVSNDLYGEVPDLSQLSLLRRIDVSNNRLWGRLNLVSQGEPIQCFSNSNYCVLSATNSTSRCESDCANETLVSGPPPGIQFTKFVPPTEPKPIDPSERQANETAEIAAMAVGSIVCVGGLICLIVALVRRKKLRAASTSSTSASPSSSSFLPIPAPPEIGGTMSTSSGNTSYASAEYAAPPLIQHLQSTLGQREEAATYGAAAPAHMLKKKSSRSAAGHSDEAYGGAAPAHLLKKKKSSRLEQQGSVALSTSSGSVALSMSSGSGVAAEAWRINGADLKLGRELGRGAFGVVREAQLHGRKVAVKFVKLDGLGGDKAAREFENEVARMSSLPPHQCVVQLLGVATVEGELAAVVEFCASGSLQDALYGRNVRAFSERQLIEFAHDAACGLDHLHRHHIIHRDIAARNVLLAGKSDLTAKIGDFGMARAGGADGMLQTVQTVGPVMWMAPEMLAARNYAAASDVFAFGVLLWEIFARQRPWPTKKVMEVAELVLQGERMAPPQGAPAAIVDVMARCWRQEANERPDMIEVRSSLGELIGDDE
jgi:hypothetical protein